MKNHWLNRPNHGAVAEFFADPVAHADRADRHFRWMTQLVLRAFPFEGPEDALDNAVQRCKSRLHKFDPAKDNGFNYFTTIILRSLRIDYRRSRRNTNG